MDELLRELLDDPSLQDVSAATEPHQLQLLIAKEQPREVATVELQLQDGSSIAIDVVPVWTVAQLKRSIEHVIEERLKKERRTVPVISWKKQWRRWELVHNGTSLDDGRRDLQSYGIAGRSTLYFRQRNTRERAKTQARSRESTRSRKK